MRVFSDFHCVTRWSRLGNVWEGVSTRELLARAGGALPEAAFVLAHGYDDGFTTNVPLADFLAEDALVAITHDGEPLTLDHGGPARLIIPRLYAWKSAKWLSRIELLPSGRSRLLGKQRLSHAWRSVERRALWLVEIFRVARICLCPACRGSDFRLQPQKAARYQGWLFVASGTEKEIAVADLASFRRVATIPLPCARRSDCFRRNGACSLFAAMPRRSLKSTWRTSASKAKSACPASRWRFVWSRRQRLLWC